MPSSALAAATSWNTALSRWPMLSPPCLILETAPRTNLTMTTDDTSSDKKSPISKTDINWLIIGLFNDDFYIAEAI
jgi:hypothetical protein